MNIVQRLSAPTPAAEKRVQVIALILEIIVSYLITYHIGPALIMYVIAGVLGGIAFLAQYAVEDINLVKGVLADPATILTAFETLASQFAEVKGLVTSQAPIDPAELASKIVAQLPPAAAPAPIVDAAPVADAPDIATAPAAEGNAPAAETQSIETNPQN